MRQYIALWVAAIVLFYVENGQAQILTYDVRLNNLLRMQQGIGWPLHLNLAEGHDALLRLSKRLENQQNCEITTPSGLTFNIHNPPNNRYSAWSDGCGVRVHNVSPSDTGRWRMTATGGNHSITGWSEVHVAVPTCTMPFQYKPPENARKRKKLTKMELQNAIDEIKGGASIRQTSNKYGIDRTTLRRYTLDEDKINKFEEKNKKVTGYTEDTITLKDGSTNTLVELTSLNSSYCFVTQPFSESSLVPGERLDVGFVRDSNNHINLYCNILYTEKNITFCRFQKTTETSGLNIMDGLSDGRYSYYGDGFFKKHCGLTIESATSADYGTWRCTIGVQERVGTVIYQRTPMQALITVSEQEAPKIRRELTRDSSESDEEMRTVFVEENTSLTLTCRADASLQYCWFQHPNGSQYTPVERQVQGEQAFWYTGENLQSGDCGITFAHVSEIDSGIWTCHMGYKYQLGVEVTQDMEVRVTGSLAANKQEVQTEIGGATTLYCHTSNGPRPLDYCRFLSPKFIGMNLDSSVTAENAILNRYYFTPGRLLSHGDCSLTIDPVTADDLGHWFCAGLLHDQVVESKDTIHVYQERHRMPALQASLIGTSVGIVFLGLVCWCAMVQEGMAFTVADLTEKV
ncbi:hypothetical protein SFRURICE_019901 [Spodoptera frugiperda]|nr:hypothetical protein SFRURICE_019901 [Spodoptera frugiperda]